MDIRFVKMQALGNDYVYIDMMDVANRRFYESLKAMTRAGDKQAAAQLDRLQELPEWARWVQWVCNRHCGIGADGVVLISRASDADCRMIIYNADGTHAKMCGNATRCVAHWMAIKHGLYHQVRILTDSGIKLVTIVGTSPDRLYRVDMGTATVTQTVQQLGNRTYVGYLVDVGNSHFVYLASGQNEVETIVNGVDQWPQDVNVELVYQSQDGLHMVVHERGAGMTMACGTGACASAVAAYEAVWIDSDKTYSVVMPGGALQVQVNIQDNRRNVVMTGPADIVYTGYISVDEGLL